VLSIANPIRITPGQQPGLEDVVTDR